MLVPISVQHLRKLAYDKKVLVGCQCIRVQVCYAKGS